MFDTLVSYLNRYDTILIFRHVMPDGDALGSQFGLKAFIAEYFPQKKVYALGSRPKQKSSFPMSDIFEGDCSDALAIVCDTANRERIDDERYALCKEILKIDHHPIVDNFGHENLVAVKASATCEILAAMFMQAKVKLNADAASYLFCGLIADTQQFSIPSVTSLTFECAAYLNQCFIDIQACNEKMFSSSYEEYHYESLLRNKVQVIDGRLAYVIASKVDYESCHVPFIQAKDKVHVMAKVTDFEMYCLFTENEEGTYQGSLRSKKVQLNDIAARYNGGGHALASGVKHLTFDQVHELLKELNDRLENKN